MSQYDKEIEEILDIYRKTIEDESVPFYDPEYEKVEAKQRINNLLVRVRIDEIEAMPDIAINNPEILPLLAARIEQLTKKRQG